jgi:hypothetical protein
VPSAQIIFCGANAPQAIISLTLINSAMTKKIILLLLVAFNITTVFAQNSFRAIIKDSETKEPLIGATAIVEGTTNGSTADTSGLIIISNIPYGKQEIQFRYHRLRRTRTGI